MGKKVVLVTGASSGMGLETAKKLLQMGYTVYGAARRVERMKELKAYQGHIIRLDLTDEASIEECVNTILQKEGHIDILINNAGYGYYAPIENTPIEEARRQFEVNFFGLARITQLVLPSMRKRHEGRIVNISSMGGRFTIPFGGWYHGTKYVVESFTDSLRLETRSFGIKVALVEPGMIQTDWGIIANEHLRVASRNTAYETNGTIMADYLDRYYSSNKLTSPEYLSRIIVKAATDKHPKTRYLYGKYAKLFVALKTIVSDRIFDATIFRFIGLH